MGNWKVLANYEQKLTKLHFLVKEDSLEIYTPEQSYIMYAGTKNEKKVWLQKLRTAIAMLLHGEEANAKNEIGKNCL